MRWSFFISATLGYSIYYVCRLSLSIVKTPLVNEGILTESQLGIIGSGLFYSYAIGKFCNGFIADRANITRLMTIGLLGSAFINLAMGIWPGFWLFTLLWLCNGWVQSIGPCSCVVGLARWFPKNEERGTYYGIWSASHNFGEGLTFVCVALVVAHMGWRYGFYTAAAVGLAGAAMVFFFMGNRPPGLTTQTAEAQDTQKGKAITGAQFSLLRNPIIWQIAAASAFMYVARYSINSWGIFFLENGRGYSAVEASSIISVNAVCGIIGTVACGWVSDKFFRGNRFPPAVAIGLLNVVSLAAFLFIPGGHRLWHVVSMIGFGISIGALLCYLGGMIAVDLAPKNAAGAALGIVGIASYVGAGCQDIASGFLIEHFKTDGVVNFLPAQTFWVIASLASVSTTAWIWRRTSRASKGTA